MARFFFQIYIDAPGVKRFTKISCNTVVICKYTQNLRPQSSDLLMPANLLVLILKDYTFLRFLPLIWLNHQTENLNFYLLYNSVREINLYVKISQLPSIQKHQQYNWLAFDLKCKITNYSLSYLRHAYLAGWFKGL